MAPIDPEATRDIRWTFKISRREENWLKRKYGSVNKGLIAVLTHAMGMSTAPPPVYPKEPKSRRTPPRRVGRPTPPAPPHRATPNDLMARMRGNEGESSAWTPDN